MHRGRLGKVGTSAFAVIALLLGAAPKAEAAFVMTLDDLATPGIDVIVVDNTDGGVGTLTTKGASTVADSQPLDGLLGFSGAVGSFIVNVTTGSSKPLIGPARIDLNNVSISGNTGGTLQLMLTDIGFTVGAGQDDKYKGVNSLGGTTDGTVTAQGFVDYGNTEFGIGAGANTVSVGPQGPFGPVPYSDVAIAFLSTPQLMGGPVSLTEIVTITHTDAFQITSFDKELAVVLPEPQTLALFGIGLLGLGFLSRRARRTA